MNKFSKKCPNCKRLVTSRNELYMMAETGECAQCDHVRGEVLEQQRYENKNN